MDTVRPVTAGLPNQVSMNASGGAREVGHCWIGMGARILPGAGRMERAGLDLGMNAGLRCFGRGFRFRSRSMNGGLHGVPSLMVLCQYDI